MSGRVVGRIISTSLVLKMSKTMTVLGLGTRYEPRVFDRFIGSLYRTGYEGKVIIIGHECDRETFQWLKSRYPGRDLQLALIASSTDGRHITNKRFEFYEKWFRKGGVDTELTMLSDIGDVMFQKNPQDYDFDFDLHVAIESSAHRTRLIKDCPYNCGWIKRIAIEQPEYAVEVASVMNQPILCAGTIFGKTAGVKTLVYELNKRFRPFCDLSRTIDEMPRLACVAGLDQGLFNIMVHRGMLPDVSIVLTSNDGTLVNTVQAEETRLTSDGKVCNSYGTVHYVVHQYNRLPMPLRRLMSIKNAPYDFTLL